MSVKYKNTNGTIEDIAGGLSETMAQDMIDSRFQNVVLTNQAITVAAESFREIVTDIDWTDDMVVIPRWWGSNYLHMCNYMPKSGKLAIVLANPRSTSVEVSGITIYFTIIRTGVNWGA